MDMERITRPLRLAKGPRQPGSGNGCPINAISHTTGAGGARRAGLASVAVLAAMALGGDPVANADSSGFLGAVQAAGVTGIGPALLENGYNVCWQIWHGGYTGNSAAAALRQTYPTMNADEADHFVLAAYQNLCPTQGSPGDDWWAYGTGPG
jgi:hypothetical protein